MQVCTSLQTDNHASTPPLSFLQAGCPFCCPTNGVKALKAASDREKTNKQKTTYNKHQIRPRPHLGRGMHCRRGVSEQFLNGTSAHNRPFQCHCRHGTGLLGHRVNGSFGSSFTSGSPGHHFDPGARAEFFWFSKKAQYEDIKVCIFVKVRPTVIEILAFNK